MNDDLNELLDDTLDGLLFQQITKHVPDDERVGILTGHYRVGRISPGAMYPDVEHRLPQLMRPVGADQLQVTFGRHGGIRVINRVGEDVDTGVWMNGTYETDAGSGWVLG
jgi:hypothetical protein